MSVKRKTLNSAQMVRTIAIVFIVICFFMGIVCFKYYCKLRNTVQEESSNYLQEISNRIGSNVSKIIDDSYSILDTIALMIKNTNIDSFHKAKPIMDSQKKYWNCQDIMMIDENGVAYNSDGKSVSLSSDTYLQDAVINKKESMSTSQMIDNKECIVFAVPLDSVVIDNKNIVALAISYSPESFDKVLSMTSFNNQAYSHIINKDGTVVVRSSSPIAEKTGYNILSTISQSKLDSNSDFNKVKNDINNNLSGQVGFKLNGSHEYMVYIPIGQEDWYLLTFVPVSVVNAKSNLLLKITLLLCGFITLAFAILTIALIISFYRHKKNLEYIAYVDTVTRGNTIQRFYNISDELLKQSSEQHALVYMNIEKFKMLNDQFGREAGDSILRGVYDGITSLLAPNECMGRLFADNFCILITYSEDTSLTTRFEDWYNAIMKNSGKYGFEWASLSMQFGVFIITDTSMEFPYMADRAKLALRDSTKDFKNNKIKYSIYNEKVRQQLVREKQLEDMMESALEEGEFQVYLQPKYMTENEKIGGAEALVRWISKSEGMIYPDAFIPLFEKNGFIVNVDLWVFENVCMTLQRWFDEGKDLVKISVNCSRIQLKDEKFLDKYYEIFSRYNVPSQYIEIELTENMVYEDTERLSAIIDEIHSMGFGCSMDDFGSGYSSLNLIQDIPVDTLKLDKIFFRNTKNNYGRTKSVVSSIIGMAKSLSMTTVAEGVEDYNQVKMLKEIGCDYIQGYVFAKPMPISNFEELLFGLPKNDEE